MQVLFGRILTFISSVSSPAENLFIINRPLECAACISAVILGGIMHLVVLAIDVGNDKDTRQNHYHAGGQDQKVTYQTNAKGKKPDGIRSEFEFHPRRVGVDEPGPGLVSTDVIVPVPNDPIALRMTQ